MINFRNILLFNFQHSRLLRFYAVPNSIQLNKKPVSHTKKTTGQAPGLVYKDPFLLKNRILFLLKLENVNEAIALNELSKTRSVFSYNSIIEHLFKSGDYELGLKQFNKMKKRNISPNSHTYTIMINNCTNMELKNLHKMIKSITGYRGTNLNLIHYNAIIKAFCRIGHLDEAMILYNQMTNNVKNFLNPNTKDQLGEKDGELTEIDYNTVLNSNEEKEGKKIKCTLFPDSTTYVTVINAYTNNKNGSVEDMLKIVSEYVTDNRKQKEYIQKNNIRTEDAHHENQKLRSVVDEIESNFETNFVRRKLDIDTHLVNSVLLNIKNKATRQRELTSTYYLVETLFGLKIADDKDYTEYKKCDKIIKLAESLAPLLRKDNVVPDKVTINTLIQIGTHANKLSITHKAIVQMKEKHPDLLVDINHYAHLFKLITQTLNTIYRSNK